MGRARPLVVFSGILVTVALRGTFLSKIRFFSLKTFGTYVYYINCHLKTIL